MNGSRAVDPLEELRAANPVDADDLPSASLARVRARAMGELNEQNDRIPAHRRPSGPRPLVLGLAGLVTAVAVAVGVLQLGSGTGVPPGPTGPPQVGLCVESYSLATLGNRTFAFDGTVVAVDGDRATFQVEAPFKGIDTSEVTLTATGMTGGVIAPGGGVTLVPGGRYLVAGDGVFAWGCGFTQPHDGAIAAQWAAALRP